MITIQVLEHKPLIQLGKEIEGLEIEFGKLVSLAPIPDHYPREGMLIGHLAVFRKE